MDEGWLIIITLEATREELVVGLYIALSIFAPFDNETFYFIK
jgi:hypothetical protein